MLKMINKIADEMACFIMLHPVAWVCIMCVIGYFGAKGYAYVF